MNKSIQFELNKFLAVPNKLRKDPNFDVPDDEFEIDLARLFHHYFTDSYGPRDKPLHSDFEYLRFLSSCKDFRFIDKGIGVSPGKKRNVSNELGQAFCRYFLYEFCGVTYFAHMHEVLNKKTHPAFNGLRIDRRTKGDVPDYLCSRDVTKPCIAEAKGRYGGIDFRRAEFHDWREQFDRIIVTDRSGLSKKLKGYIIATSYSTESKPRKKSKIYAEDPETEGDTGLGESDSRLGLVCLAIHYSRLVSKLGLSLISESLGNGFVVPQDLTFNLPVWECIYPPLKSQRFVGGFISDVQPNFEKLPNGRHIFYPNILQLGIPFPAFYGIQIDVFRILRQACLGNWTLLAEIVPLNDEGSGASNLAWLRDGSISGSLDLFELVGTERF